MKQMAKLDLSRYEKMYDSFDAGHNRDHFIAVRKLAVSLAKKYLPDKVELAYIAATLHDIGLSVDRENHEITGEKLIRQDKYLSSNLSSEDFEELCQAVGQHRASTGNPQTVLAKIISDADRGGGFSKSYESFNRSYSYNSKKNPNLTEDKLLLSSAEYQVQKFSEGSYGRRTYFPETEERLKNIYNPIIEAYRKQDLKYFRRLIKTLVE
jgi:uncharacterized protein